MFDCWHASNYSELFLLWEAVSSFATQDESVQPFLDQCCNIEVWYQDHYQPHMQRKATLKNIHTQSG